MRCDMSVTYVCVCMYERLSVLLRLLNVSVVLHVNTFERRVLLTLHFLASHVRMRAHTSRCVSIPLETRRRIQWIYTFTRPHSRT